MVTSIHAFELRGDGALQPLPVRKLDGEWRVAIALEGSRLFLGLPGADTPGRRTEIEISSAGTAPWSRGQAVVGAGVVNEFELTRGAVVDAGTLYSPDAHIYQKFGAQVFASTSYLAVSAPTLDALPSLYVFARTAPAAPLKLETSGVQAMTALAFTPDGFVATEQTVSDRRLGIYSLSAGKYARTGEIPDPEPGEGFSFGSSVAIADNRMLVMSLGPGANDDGERVNPAVDLYSQISPGVWVRGKRVRAGSQYSNYATVSIAALSSERAYMLTDTGVDEWSEAAGSWTLTQQLKAAELAPNVQVNSIAAHSKTLALLLQSVSDGTSAPRLFVTTRSIQ